MFHRLSPTLGHQQFTESLATHTIRFTKDGMALWLRTLLGICQATCLETSRHKAGHLTSAPTPLGGICHVEASMRASKFMGVHSMSACRWMGVVKFGTSASPPFYFICCSPCLTL